MPEQKTICQRVRDWYEDTAPYWDAKHESYRELKGFLAGDRYEDDPGPYNRDRRLIQIHGQETQDTIRHIIAKVTEKPRSIEARPIDDDTDPDSAEVAASLVEGEFGNPWKNFQVQLERALLSAREKRLGVVWMDWVPEQGAYGEMLYRYVNPSRIRWDPAYEPHDPMCEQVLEERRMPVPWIHKHFKGSGWVTADKDATTPAGEVKPGIPLVRDGSGVRIPRAYKDNKATLWYCWYKNDQTYMDKESATDKGLEPEERYMACLDGCGYRGEPQGEGEELPENDTCPTCGGMTERIDAIYQSEQVLAYEKGKRLVIMAPFAAAPDDKPLYDGKWPIPTARSFPGFFITAYLESDDQIGPCDTDLMWDQQAASDQLRTMAVQRVFEHRMYWDMPSAGITDVNGRRYEMRDDQSNVMFRDMTKNQFGDLTVKQYGGTGLDPQFATAFNITQQALTQYRGMNDLGPVEERSKAKSGVALQTENAIGEVPVSHFRRRVQYELSKFAGVVWDYVKATYTPERLQRLNIEGVDLVVGLQGDDLPNFDFVIEDTPDFAGLEAARAQAFDGLVAAIAQATQLGVDPIEYASLYAEVNQMPRSVVRKLEKLFARAKQEAEQKAQAEAQMAEQRMSGMGGELPLEPIDEGLNGGGMVPSPVA